MNVDEMSEKHKYPMACPVCGAEVDMFDICENCDWQNGGPDSTGNMRGPNHMTLEEARAAYKEGRPIN